MHPNIGQQVLLPPLEKEEHFNQHCGLQIFSRTIPNVPWHTECWGNGGAVKLEVADLDSLLPMTACGEESLKCNARIKGGWRWGSGSSFKK